MKRYTKREREEAADILAMAADIGISGFSPALYEVSDVEGEAEDLAHEAWEAHRWPSHGDYVPYPWCYLEASASLRDGWLPGDPVVRR